MYAIVEIAGQQFKVAKDQKVFVNRLKGDEGANVTFDQVLLIGDGDAVTVGAPAIDGAAVEAKILKHLKGDKIIVFKKKRRKGYRVKNGHRQPLTQLVIEGILEKGAKKTKKAASTPKTEAKSEKVAEPKAAAKITAPKKEAPKKEAPAKKVAKPSKDLSSLTVAELKDMAKAKGLSGYSALKKAELIEALQGK
jgi:large subunit ribosomal protein L21